jgi:hypothetical protein
VGTAAALVAIVHRRQALQKAHMLTPPPEASRGKAVGQAAFKHKNLLIHLSFSSWSPKCRTSCPLGAAEAGAAGPRAALAAAAWDAARAEAKAEALAWAAESLVHIRFGCAAHSLHACGRGQK